MGVDIRFPIGLMFAILGALLTLYGLFGALTGSTEMYARHSLGINVNLWWGILVFIFGAVMLRFGWRGWARGAADRPGAGEGTSKAGPGGGH